MIEIVLVISEQQTRNLLENWPDIEFLLVDNRVSSISVIFLIFPTSGR